MAFPELRGTSPLSTQDVYNFITQLGVPSSIFGGGAIAGPITITSDTDAHLTINNTTALSTAGGIVMNTNSTLSVCGLIQGKRSTLRRWNIELGDALAESGSNAGSDLNIVSFTDAGAGALTVLKLLRNNLGGTLTTAGSFAIQNLAGIGKIRFGPGSSAIVAPTISNDDGFGVRIVPPVIVGSTNASPQLLSGTGSPSGVVTAPSGSIYMQKDGTAGSRVFINQNAGTTWIAIALV